MKPKETNNTVAIRFRMQTSLLHRALPREEGAVHVLVACLLMLAIGYVGFVSMSIVNVIARKEALDKVVSVRATVGQLEHQYFALAQELTEESGTQLGLLQVSDTRYVHSPGAVGAADGGRNEI